MKEVIKYLDRLKKNILSIKKMRMQHEFMIDVIEKNQLPLTKGRLNQFRETNKEINSFIND